SPATTSAPTRSSIAHHSNTQSSFPPKKTKYCRSYSGTMRETEESARIEGKVLNAVNLKQRILIIDIDRVIADTLAQIFSNKGFEARAFYDAERALAATEEWRPNFAVLEFILTDMNGLDCAIRLNQRYPDCAIILLFAQV